MKLNLKNIFLYLLIIFCQINLLSLNSASALDIENNCSANNSYLIFDAKSQQVLLQKNANEIIYPASLTKVMTAYLVFDAI